MKTSKQAPSDLVSSRRAQPLRQTRNNPPRSSLPGSRALGSRGSHSGGLEEKDIEIFPAITHFADAITALPKELVRHFTLLKEVDAKTFAPEEDLQRLVDAALNAPLPQPQQPVEPQHALGPTSTSMSAQGSVNGSIANGQAGSAASTSGAVDVYNPPNAAAYDPANLPRRQLFQHTAFTMQNMLVSLDEKNHVISTAAEALNKQLARIDDCFPYIELEVSEEARYGSTTHWAYPENRVPKTNSGSRREIASVNNLSAAAQHLAEEAAARSDARKQALLERKKGKNQHVESDFDDHHDGRHKEKKLHGNSKIRKAADASLGVGLGITNGATNGNPPKRRKVEKGPSGGAVMERSMSGVFGSNGAATKGKGGSPRETPGPEGSKKRSRGAATTNGQTRKRNNTVTSVAMSPSLASSPIRSTFPDSKSGRPSPPPTNGKPAASRARQNSTQSMNEKRPPSAASNKPNGTATPDLGAAAKAAANATGRTIAEVKSSMKETMNAKGEHLLEDTEQDNPEMVGGLVVGNRKDSVAKREGSEANGDSMQGIQSTTVTTKSGRASKPSTPAIPSFPEPVRSRSSRNALETASNNKRSHKKGAGAAAQQQLIAQQNAEMDDATSNAQDEDEDEDINPDEPLYCYCNGVSYGEMVGCDADGCEREWFHLECVGLKVAPKGNAKWYCDDCKKKLKSSQRFNGR